MEVFHAKVDNSNVLLRGLVDPPEGSRYRKVCPTRNRPSRGSGTRRSLRDMRLASRINRSPQDSGPVVGPAFGQPYKEKSGDAGPPTAFICRGFFFCVQSVMPYGNERKRTKRTPRRARRLSKQSMRNMRRNGMGLERLWRIGFLLLGTRHGPMPRLQPSTQSTQTTQKTNI